MPAGEHPFYACDYWASTFRGPSVVDRAPITADLMLKYMELISDQARDPLDRLLEEVTRLALAGREAELRELLRCCVFPGPVIRLAP